MRTTFFFAGFLGAFMGQTEALNLNSEAASELAIHSYAPSELDAYLDLENGLDVDNELDAFASSESENESGGGDDKGKKGKKSAKKGDDDQSDEGSD